jgi:hypothetical protein
LEDILNSNDTFTLLKKWCSLKRGDFILIEGEAKERVVTHVIEINDEVTVITFSDEYSIIDKKEKSLLKDFKVVSFYFLDRDKELSLIAR